MAKRKKITWGPKASTLGRPGIAHKTRVVVTRTGSRGKLAGGPRHGNVMVTHPEGTRRTTLGSYKAD